LLIRCPNCKTSYRLPKGKYQSPRLGITCPSCRHRFCVQPASSDAGRKPLVLVVDDSPYFRELLCDLLGPLNVSLLAAASAEEALEILRKRRIDLLVADLNLPGHDGFELIRVLRSRYPYPLKIVAISGMYQKDRADERLRTLGADAFLPKSFSPAEFLARVKPLLNLS